MLRNLSEKLRAKFPATTRGLSSRQNLLARLDDAVPAVFEQEASPVKGQSLQQKDKKTRKRKGKKIMKKKKPKDVHHLLKILISAHA